MSDLKWSYSSLGLFQQCPRKYYHLRVLKDVKDPETEAILYGKRVHEAAEFYIGKGTPLPPPFEQFKPVLDMLKEIPGDKLCEFKMGLTKNIEACAFFAKDVWWRGIVDLLIVDDTKGWMIDYKTGKNAKYADMKQLDLMAGALFIKHPELETIKSALAYVVSNEFPKKVHKREKLDEYMSVFDDQLDQLDAAMENGVWNAKTSPLCGWCPVTSCEHWKPRRK
jgi:hypothetical protein